LLFLLREEASPSIGNTLWRVSTTFTHSAITPPDVNEFGRNLGTPSMLFGAGPDRIWARSAQTRERETLRKFCFLSCKQRTSLPIFGQPIFTKLAHKTCFWEAGNPFGNIFWIFALKGSFFEKHWSSSTISDFGPRFLGNDYKSWKVMTGWPAYGMLAFHPNHRNQLKVIRLASMLRTKKDFPGHRRLFRLVLQTYCRIVIRVAALAT